MEGSTTVLAILASAMKAAIGITARFITTVRSITLILGSFAMCTARRLSTISLRTA